jgi:hypothetical protein
VEETPAEVEIIPETPDTWLNNDLPDETPEIVPEATVEADEPTKDTEAIEVGADDVKPKKRVIRRTFKK